MKRRDFLATVAAATCSASINWNQTTSLAQEPTAPRPNGDNERHKSVVPSREFLFTDVRYIDPGDLVWRGPDGKAIPVAGPAEPPVEAVPDDQGVARGIRVVAQKANKEGPIAGGPPGGVTYADGLYRGWRVQTNYQGKDLGSYSVAPARSISIGYAESKDGYAWQHRTLNEIPVSGISGLDGDGFFVDPNGPPEERYKGIFNAHVIDDRVTALWQTCQKQTQPRTRHCGQGPDHIYCLFGLVSPDGLNWKLLPDPVLIHQGDTDNTAYYDQKLQKYIIYSRLIISDRRVIGRAESDDFHHFSPVVEPIIAASLSDPCSYDVYTNARTNYPGLPEQHLMFPLIYRRDTQTSEIHIYTSRDGILWDRVPGGPVLEPSDPPGWDGVYIGAGKNLVPLGQDRVAIPYVGYKRPHKYPRWPGVLQGKGGWAWWPKGRLVALVADKEGQFNTFGVNVTGRKLQVNARVHAGGEIRVGIRGTKGREPSDCDPLTGDNLAHTVTWRGDPDPTVELGKAVSLRFQLRAAELFGFQWA